MFFFFKTFRMAIQALHRNIMRSILTTLGIIIGVGAVIAMTDIGKGTAVAIQARIKSMGANNLLIQPGTATSSGASQGIGSMMTLTPQDAEAIATDCPAIEAVAPIVRARTQVIYNNLNWVPVYIFGTTPEYLRAREWEALAEGESFTQRDVTNAAKVVILGQTVSRNLFPSESPIGKEVRVNNVAFKVIGVLTRKGASMQGQDQDDILLAPWTTIKKCVAGSSMAQVNQSTTAVTDPALKVFPGSAVTPLPVRSPTQMADLPNPVRLTNIDWILLKVASAEEIPVAIVQVRELLRDRHRIKADQPEDFNIRDSTELSKNMASTQYRMMNLLFFVAVVSLLVGGIGIMNIMLVSVTERTREIGLRMAVGARSRDILMQFLVESIVLCVLGGLLGILFGKLGGWLVSYLNEDWPIVHSLGVVIASVLVAGGVGVVFGFYPAWKASRLDPIDALRFE